MNVYYFNPDNDLALANGGEHYTPTPMAERMRHDLQLLPCWLAEPGNAVLCDDATLQSWVDARGLDLRIITPKDLPHLKDCSFRPWGWNPAMRWRLLHWGAAESLLPTKNEIEVWRQLAHRRISIKIHNRISQLTGIRLCPAPVELSTIDDILHFATAHPGCYVKEPWSGSGRGIYRALDPHGQDFIQRCSGALNRQGSMLCEEALERILDFALEFTCRESHVHFAGYSVFESDFHLQYECGIVRNEQELKAYIESQFPHFQLIYDAIIQVLDEIIAPHYEGELGVDMLLYRNHDGSLGINPCVELNLRTTMGAVTAALGNRHGLKGRFAIIKTQDLNDSDTPLTPVQNDIVAVINIILLINYNLKIIFLNKK